MKHETIFTLIMLWVFTVAGAAFYGHEYALMFSEKKLQNCIKLVSEQ